MRNEKIHMSSYLYIIPILSIIILFWYIPIIISIFLSFTQYGGLTPPVFNGLTNYKMLFQDEIFIQSITVALKFIFLAVPLQVALAFFVAAWVDRKSKTKAAYFVRNAMIIPFLASTSVLGIVIRIMLNNPKSPLSPIMGIFGLESSQLLGTETTALSTLIIIKILTGAGYYMILYMASLTDIPRSYYDSAIMDGASPWTVYTRITFPLVKKTTLLLIFLGSIDALKIFDLIYTMTGGGPGTSATLTPMVYLYMYGFKYSKVGYSMAIGTVIIVLALSMVLIMKKFVTNKDSNMY